MRQRQLVRALVSVMLGLTGCFRSPTPRFFTLTPISTENASVVPSPQGPRVGLVSLTMPPYLLDPRMSLVAGGNEVVRDEFDRWAEDLDENFRRVLLENLSRELASSNVSSVDSPFAQSGACPVRIEVLRFDADTSRVARLRARWSVGGDSASSPTVISDWSEQVRDDTTEARVEALSLLVARLAGEIAGHVH